MTHPSAHLGLSVDNLHKRFGEREVLRGVSLAAKPGDVVALIGASGSGKSTLLRCLNLLEQPHEGTLRLGAETLQLKRDRDAVTHMARMMYGLYGNVFRSLPRGRQQMPQHCIIVAGINSQVVLQVRQRNEVRVRGFCRPCVTHCHRPKIGNPNRRGPGFHLVQ